MNTPTQTVLLVSSDVSSLADALAPFKEAGFTLHIEATLDAALPLLHPATPPALVLIDARQNMDGAALRQAVMRVLSRCALTWISAVTSISAVAFHDAMEGLGMLPPLPTTPNKKDGEALLSALQRFQPKN